MALTKITRGVIKANENYDTHNINSTGIVTAVSANFTGDVSIGGTLTYQDVTNIDSVGVITARNGLHVTSGSIFHYGSGSASNPAITLSGTAPSDTLVTTSTGKVGIGTDNPTANLTVYGSTSAALFQNSNTGTSSGDGFFVGNWGGLTASIWQYENDVINFGTNNTERLRITSDGKLGVGCTPETDFQVRNGNGGTIKIGGSGSGATGFQIQYNNSGTTTTELLTNYRSTSASASLKIDTGTFLVATGTNGAERLRITPAGEMGLGTNSPGSYDGEADDFVVAGSDHTGITIASTGSNKRTNLYFADGTSGNERYRGAFTYDHNSDYLQVRTSGAERLRIDSDGNVNIGNKDHHSHNGTVDALQIGYALNLYEDSYTSGTDNYAIWSNNAYYAGSGGNKYMRDDEASRIYQHSGQIVFETAAAGTVDNAITFNERLRITQLGGYVLKSYGRSIRYYTTTTNNSMYRTVAAISMAGSSAYEIRFTGTGNGITHAKCMASHWTSNYDLIRDSYIAMDSYSGLSIHDQFNKTSGTQGAWSFSRPSSGQTGYQSHFVINKSAGSYGGGMIGCIVLEADRPYELLSIT